LYTLEWGGPKLRPDATEVIQHKSGQLPPSEGGAQVFWLFIN